MISMIMFMTFEYPDKDKRFRDFAARYWNAMKRAAVEILGDDRDAEDACQEAFIKLYSRFDRYNDLDDKSLLALLYRITRNASLDIYRKEHRTGWEKVSYNDDLFISFNEHCDRDENIVLEALKSLNDSDREAILLKYYYDYDVDSIAELYGLTVKSAYKKLERARKKLKKAIGEVRDGKNDD